jgi:hypothetical protein
LTLAIKSAPSSDTPSIYQSKWRDNPENSSSFDVFEKMSFIFFLQVQNSLIKIREVFFLIIFLNIYLSNILIQTSNKRVEYILIQKEVVLQIID